MSTFSRILCSVIVVVLGISAVGEGRDLSVSEMKALGLPHYIWDGKYDNIQYVNPRIHARFRELLELNAIEFIEHQESIYTLKSDHETVWKIQDQVSDEGLAGRFGPPPEQTPLPYDQGYPFKDEAIAKRFAAYLAELGVPHTSNPSRNEYVVVWAPRDEQERAHLKSVLTKFIQE